MKDANGVPLKDTEGNYLYTEGPQLSVFSRKRENYRKQGENKMHCNGNHIFFCDLERGNDARITNYLRKKSIENAYVITRATPEFLAETGIDEVMIKASTLAKPERIRPEHIDTDGTRVYVKRTTLRNIILMGVRMLIGMMLSMTCVKAAFMLLLVTVKLSREPIKLHLPIFHGRLV